jgi:hypothetical protein
LAISGSALATRLFTPISVLWASLQASTYTKFLIRCLLSLFFGPQVVGSTFLRSIVNFYQGFGVTSKKTVLLFISHFPGACSYSYVVLLCADLSPHQLSQIRPSSLFQ